MADDLFDGEAIRPDEIKDTIPGVETKQEEKQLAPIMPTLPVPNDLTKEEWLMYTILQTGTIEAFDKFIAVKERTMERQAKALFDEHFAKMQSEFTAVARDKEGYEYTYAPIETLQKGFGPTIAKHGFSYKWKESAIQELPGWKRVIMIISGWGHSEENYFDVPPLEFTGKMKDRVNAVQAAGGESTYGQRYTFKAGFGLIIGGEDNDASSFEAGTIMAVSDDVARMKACKTIEELGKVYKEVYDAKKIQSDIDEATRKIHLSLIIKAKDEMKKELTPTKEESTKK